jgi:sialidase-1
MKQSDFTSVDQVDLFVAGEHGYHTYRIPSLLTTVTGTMLAFCEARKHSGSDTGDIDVAMRRSIDGGRTWDAMRIIADAGDDVFDNPCPVQDRSTRTIWMPLCWNRADGGEGEIIRGDAKRGVWLMSSEDDGLTWSDPVEITDDVKEQSWTWYATGPGHGIQLSNGRLVIPCDFGKGLADDDYQYFGSHVITSDDHGRTWQIGGTIQGKVNECQAVELSDGRLLLNMRSYHGGHCRGIATSRDGGDTWSEPDHDERLVEPICQAAILRLADGSIAFSNPASTERENMTVRFSGDDCRTWDRAVVLHDGPAAYSDLAQNDSGAVNCLYERGEDGPYERITLARLI